MSFQFRRRNDVREQSSQQEPFFQNLGRQQSFTRQDGTFSQMGHQEQEFDERLQFNGYIPPAFTPHNSVYGQQQTNPHQQMQNVYGVTTHQQHMAQQQLQDAYLHPVQSSQLNAQRVNNYVGNNLQQPNYQYQNFASNMQNQSQGYFNNLSAFPSKDEPMHQYNGNPVVTNPMAFWNEPQNAVRFDSNESDHDTNSPVKLLVSVAGIALVAALSWFAYKWAKSPSTDTPPLIHADLGSHKVSPDHRGGINIPYQDKLIYNRIDDSTSDDQAERLLPPPEQPSVNQQRTSINNNQGNPQVQMQNNGVLFPQNTMPQQPQMNVQSNQQQYQSVPNQTTQNQPIQVQNVPVPAISQQVIAQNQIDQTSQVGNRKTSEDNTATDDEPRATKTKVSETTAETNNGSYYVQLATVKSEAAAIKEWNRLKNKYNLKGQKSQIKESERPDGETVFRLLMGPFTEKVKALKHAVKIDGTKVIHVMD